MQHIQIIAGFLIAAVLGYWLFVRHARKAKALAETPQRLFGDIIPLLENAGFKASETAGIWKLQGEYRGHLFQFQAIADTLAVRKLPSLWLMVTLPEPQPVKAILDLVMRPTGPTTFSKFDFLPHTLRLPEGFPDHAVIRSDLELAPIPADCFRRQLDDFQAMRGKELLITPNGLRVVTQAAEADRARYGVLREANFGDTIIDAATALRCMDMLLSIRDDMSGHG